MAKIFMSGGGGPNLGVVDAGPEHILANKVIVDKYGNPLVGTMPDRGAVNQSLAINGTYTISAGYHNGQGKVTQNITTMAAQTINPTASQQVVSSANKYMTGNVTVNGVSNLTAANVKRGQTVGGTAGECDWVTITGTSGTVIVDKTFSPTVVSLSNIYGAEWTTGGVIWEGSVHPEFNTVFLRINFGDYMCVGKSNGGHYEVFFVEIPGTTTIVYRMNISRDTNGYMKVYLMATNSESNLFRIRYKGGTNVDI